MRTKYATVKDVNGLVYELQGNKLVQPYQYEDYDSGQGDQKVTRTVTRASIRTSEAKLRTLYEDGIKFVYNINVTVYKGRLSVGCRDFGKSATKKILEWAGYKAKKGK